MASTTTTTTQYIAIRDDSASLSNAERDFIITAALSTSTRTDGRKYSDRRPVQIRLVRADNYASCTVLLGAVTRVTCQVTGELVPPHQDARPNEGSIAFSVDISPAASTTYRHATPASTGGGGGPAAASANLPLADRHQKLTCNHILRCLERCLLQGGALDTEALCVVPGLYVWKLQVAVTVLDDGGNLVDASVLACLAAVRHYRKPVTEHPHNSDSGAPVLIPANLKEPTPLPLHHTPLTITFALFQKSKDSGSNMTTTALLIDPTAREELCQTGSITIAMNVHSEICLLDFSGGCELTIATLRELHHQAAAHIQPLCQSLETSLEQADEQVLQERLEQLKKQQQQQLPPLTEVVQEPPPAVPYFAQISQEQVPVDAVHDQAIAEEDAAVAAKEEEAYRRQALDYNLGHVASKVRENKPAPQQQKSATSGSSSLLAAMLASVQGDTNNLPADEPQTPVMELVVDEEAPPKQLPPPTRILPPAPEVETAPNAKTTAATTQSKQFLSDDDEEEATVQIVSEFQSVVRPASQTAATNNDDDDDVDDLAAAIKTKSKKKKKGKKK